MRRKGGEEQEKQNFCLVVLEVVALQVLVSLLCISWTQGWGSRKVFSHPSMSPRCHSEPSHSNKSFKDYGRKRKVTFRLASLSLSQGKICDIKGTQEEAGLEELFT